MLDRPKLNNLNLINTAFNLAQSLDKAVDRAISAEELADVVKLHGKIAVGSNFIPVPGVSILALATNIWTMYARINNIVGISFSESVLKSIAAGCASNILSNLFTYTVGESIKVFLPGIGSVIRGLAMSTSVYVSVITAGIVYMKALTFLLNQDAELTEVNLEEAVNSILQDKEQIQEIFSSVDREQY